MEVLVNGPNFTVKVNGFTTLAQPYSYSNTWSHTAYSGGGVGLLSQIYGITGAVSFFDNFVIPEPTTSMLLGVGGLLLWRRRLHTPAPNVGG